MEVVASDHEMGKSHNTTALPPSQDVPLHWLALRTWCAIRVLGTTAGGQCVFLVCHHRMLLPQRQLAGMFQLQGTARCWRSGTTDTNVVGRWNT